MLISTEKKFVRGLLFLLVGGQIIFITLIYAISSAQGYLNYPEFFPSDAFRLDPTRAIASFLLPMNAIIMIAIVGLRLRRLQPLLNSRKAKHVWTAVGVVQALATIGLLGLAAFSTEYSGITHSAFAGLCFFAGVILTVLFSWLDEIVLLVRPKWIRGIRIAISGALVLDVFIMFAFPISLSMFSICELILIHLYTAYPVTYWHDSEYPMRSVGG